MDFARDVWPVLSFALNLLFVLIGALALRWFAGVLKSFQQDLRIAVLELKEELSKTYATAPDLAAAEERLRREINIAGRMDAGFNTLGKLVAKHGREAQT